MLEFPSYLARDSLILQLVRRIFTSSGPKWVSVCLSVWWFHERSIMLPVLPIAEPLTRLRSQFLHLQDIVYLWRELLISLSSAHLKDPLAHFFTPRPFDMFAVRPHEHQPKKGSEREKERKNGPKPSRRDRGPITNTTVTTKPTSKQSRKWILAPHSFCVIPELCHSH